MAAPVGFTQAATGGHSVLPPSSAAVWELCPGSVQLQALFPELPSAHSAEGDACHWLMRQVLHFGVWPEVGTATPSGVLVDQTMREAVAVMRDVLREVCQDLRGMVVESPVRIASIHADCWGTPDVYVWFWRGTRLCLLVCDLKYGFDPVEVFENRQLTCYASGVFDAENFRRRAAQQAPLGSLDVDVIFMVYQPRAYHRDGPIRSWSTNMNALQPLIERLSWAADEALSPVAQCKPQPAACRYCSARANCDVLQTSVYQFSEVARKAIPATLSDAALSLELATLSDAADLLKARITGLEEVAKHRLTTGHQLPHWKFAPGRGATVWTKPPAEIIAAAQMFGKDVRQPVAVITPIQAKTLGVPSEIVDMFSQSVPGATKLTRDNGLEAKRIFTAE